MHFSMICIKYLYFFLFRNSIMLTIYKRSLFFGDFIHMNLPIAPQYFHGCTSIRAMQYIHHSISFYPHKTCEAYLQTEPTGTRQENQNHLLNWWYAPALKGHPTGRSLKRHRHFHHTL